MSFISPAQGQRVLHSHVTQLINALTGVSGAAEALAFTALSNSSSYALDLRNLDSTNSYGLRVRDSGGNDLFKVYLNNIVLGSAATHTTTIYGNAFIGDTSNANATLGLTINQGANDNELFAGKSSDIDHGVTTLAETDTFILIKKQNADNGGVQMDCFGEGAIGFMLRGIGVTDTTTKTTGSDAYTEVRAYKKNSTGVQDCGTDANLFAIINNTTARFIFDAEGSFHADVESTTFDDYDDLALVEALDSELNRRNGRTVDGEFDEWLAEKKEILQREKIVNFYDDGPRVMLNITRLSKLHSGTLRQLGRRMARFEAAMLKMGADPALLTEATA